MSELRLETSLTLSHHRLQVRPSRPKAWKVRAQTAPASLSCVPRAAFTWRTSTSAPDFFLSSIHQNRFMLSTTPPHSPPAPLLKIHHDEQGLCLFHQCLWSEVRLLVLYAMTDGCFFVGVLFFFHQLWKHFINSLMVFSRVSWPRRVDSRDISLPVTVVLLSTLTLN